MCFRFRRVERVVRRVLFAITASALASCSSHTDSVVAPTAHLPAAQGTPLSNLFPGGANPPAPAQEGARYANDPDAIAQGARLFDTYNCSGCHFHGAGGIGPALMDDKWIYGGSMDQIYATIDQGRPNGMPAWGSKLSATDIWKLTAYVHDLAARNAAGSGAPVPPLPAVHESEVRMPAAQTPASASEQK